MQCIPHSLVLWCYWCPDGGRGLCSKCDTFWWPIRGSRHGDGAFDGWFYYIKYKATDSLIYKYIFQHACFSTIVQLTCAGATPQQLHQVLGTELRKCWADWNKTSGLLPCQGDLDTVLYELADNITSGSEIADKCSDKVRVAYTRVDPDDATMNCYSSHTNSLWQRYRCFQCSDQLWHDQLLLGMWSVLI